MTALLQIAEPDQATERQQYLAGIDLGTTHSLIAIIGGNGRPQVLDVDGLPLLPSAVAYTPDGIRVGRAALQTSGQPAAALFTSVKRAMGLTCGELAKADLPFAVSGEATDPALLTAAESIPDNMPDNTSLAAADRQALPPEQISAEILRHLAACAEQHLSAPLDGIVLTVPAYFSESQRQATMRAAALAGLNVLRLISEPTAAALAYGLDRAATGAVMVYDLGGGTFDCSVLVLKEGIFEVRATAGDIHLGGDDLDWALASEALAAWQLGWPDLNATEHRQLLHHSRNTKEALSCAERAEIALTLAGTMRQMSLSAADMDRLAAPLLRRTIGLCRRALRDAEMELEQIDELVLVGGATRMPALREAVRQFFRREPQTGLDPDQTVARGAAMHARAVGGNGCGNEALLVDVTPLSLGIETLGGLTETIMPRNSPVPAMQAKEFTTAKDGQTALSLHVVQGERTLAEECRSLARFRLSGIPPMAAGAARIRIAFAMDESGLLRVHAREQSTGTEAQVETSRVSAFAEGEVRRMLQSADESADDDEQLRRQREAVLAGETLLEHLRSALKTDSGLLDAAGLKALKAAMSQLQSNLKGGKTDAIRRALASLNEVTDDFAQKRMDATVKAALAGSHLDELKQ